jgi:hypothetical protein
MILQQIEVRDPGLYLTAWLLSPFLYMAHVEMGIVQDKSWEMSKWHLIFTNEHLDIDWTNAI